MFTLFFSIVGGLFSMKYIYDKVNKFLDNKEKKIIFSNKYDCMNPNNAQAWLCVSSGINYYIYPFDYMEYCVCEANKLWCSYVIFNYTRVPISTGGYYGDTEECKEIGRQWLQQNFIWDNHLNMIPPMNNINNNFPIFNSNVVNDILQLPERDKQKVLQKCSEEYLKIKTELELSFKID